MNIFLILFLVLSPSAFADPTDITHETILPEVFTVYHHPEYGVSTSPFKKATPKKIFTNNDYKEIPGCYILCLSKNKKRAAYALDHDTYIIGQIRVPGHYADGLCIAKDYEEHSLTELKNFKEQCEKAFPERCEKENCWASPRQLGF